MAVNFGNDTGLVVFRDFLVKKSEYDFKKRLREKVSKTPSSDFNEVACMFRLPKDVSKKPVPIRRLVRVLL